MKFLLYLIQLAVLPFCVLGASNPNPGPGGAPNVTTISSGVNLANVAVVNDSVLQLGRGDYQAGTPTLLNSNLNTRTAVGGIVWQNLTNVTLYGVGWWSSRIFGTNGLGELHWISNCLNVRIEGVGYYGYTNLNFTLLPGYSPLTTNEGSYLWGSVVYYKCANFYFDRNAIIGSADHGIEDKANENSSILASSQQSTNNINIRWNYFANIGSYRTNSSIITTAFAQDGTAIVPTTANVIGNFIEYCHRGIEPYDDVGGGNVFNNCKLEDNTIMNVADSAILFAGSTNSDRISIRRNYIENINSWSWNGTNFGKTVANQHGGYGIMVNGGRYGKVQQNTIKGTFYSGMFIGNATSGCDDWDISDNDISDIQGGDQVFGTGIWIGTLGTGAGDAASVKRLRVRNNRLNNLALRGINVSRGNIVWIEGNTGINAGGYANAGTTFASVVLGQDGVTGLSTCWVKDNAFSATLGQTAAYGVADNVTGLTMANNFATGFAYADGITNRSGNVVAIESPPLAIATAIDIPSVAGGQLYQTNFAFTGVTTNDFITILPPLAWNQGLGSNYILKAFGSSAVCYVQFINSSNSASDLPSTAFGFEARKKRSHGQ